MASNAEAIATAATVILPSVISLIRAVFVQQNPDSPPPTSAEVILALNSAVAKSLAADDLWLSQHPK